MELSSQRKLVVSRTARNKARIRVPPRSNNRRKEHGDRTENHEAEAVSSMVSREQSRVIVRLSLALLWSLGVSLLLAGDANQAEAIGRTVLITAAGTSLALFPAKSALERRMREANRTLEEQEAWLQEMDAELSRMKEAEQDAERDAERMVKRLISDELIALLRWQLSIDLASECRVDERRAIENALNALLRVEAWPSPDGARRLGHEPSILLPIRSSPSSTSTFGSSGCASYPIALARLSPRSHNPSLKRITL